ncbi:PREDICTED: lariat debranching enzyme-like [Nicotiana attenuata]|nr:PREDICTED: lariat debranching enzyme-like [Nicotiana attenuata]
MGNTKHVSLNLGANEEIIYFDVLHTRTEDWLSTEISSSLIVQSEPQAAPARGRGRGHARGRGRGRAQPPVATPVAEHQVDLGEEVPAPAQTVPAGPAQAVRNEKDLESINVPLKYRSMNSFWKYYSGEKVAPFPTIFIGGNHEASNYLWELYYGGWAAPQIYFLGFAGVIKFGNIRIGGLSGIYKSHDYNRGHYEKLPYNQRDIRSIYHVREYDVHKLLQVEEPIDIFLSHDWPVGITDCGNLKALLRQKPFFEQEIQEGTLGSRPAAELLAKLRPSYWFSAHLHCKFAALVQHEKDGPSTKFLALDKCLPGRKFLQVIEIESGPGPHELQFDEEWLAITRKYNAVLPLTTRSANYSDVHLDTEQCHEFVRNKLQTRGSKPFEFVQTAPCYNPSHPVANGVFHGCYKNPQTEALLQFLELDYLLNKMPESKGA